MNITSPSFPNGIEPLRSESEYRDLMRARLRAREAYYAAGMLNSEGMTEDQRLDRAIESERLMREMFAADDAVAAYTRKAAP